MKNRRSQRRINHSLTQVLIVTAGLVLMLSAPCTLAEHPTDLLNVSVQVEAISEATAESGTTVPSRAASATELERAVSACGSAASPAPSPIVRSDEG